MAITTSFEWISDDNVVLQSRWPPVVARSHWPSGEFLANAETGLLRFLEPYWHSFSDPFHLPRTNVFRTTQYDQTHAHTRVHTYAHFGIVIPPGNNEPAAGLNAAAAGVVRGWRTTCCRWSGGHTKPARQPFFPLSTPGALLNTTPVSQLRRDTCTHHNLLLLWRADALFHVFRKQFRTVLVNNIVAVGKRGRRTSEIRRVSYARREVRRQCYVVR